MAKKTKRNKERSVDVVTIDQLALMTDDELYSARRGYDDRLAAKRREDEVSLTTEIAYIDRELQIRQARREAHTSWCRDEDAAWNKFWYQEDSLPEMDFESNYRIACIAGSDRRGN